jgi:hypothetical protein
MESADISKEAQTGDNGKASSKVWSVDDALKKLANPKAAADRPAIQPKQHDAFTPTPPDEELEERAEKALEEKLQAAEEVERPSIAGEPSVEAPPTPLPEAPAVSKHAQAFDTFSKSRSRVRFDVSDGIFTIPVIKCVRSKYCINLFLPLSDDTMVFVPKPGTQLSITTNTDGVSATYQVYFPGTYSEIPELGMAIMTLIMGD